MHFTCAGIAHHLHDLYRRCAADDRIIDQYDALATDDGAVGTVLEPNAKLADVLGGLDKGPPDIVIADNAKLVRDAGFLGVSDRRRHAGIGDRNDHIGGSRSLAREFGARGLADVVDAASADDRIRPGEVDVFEDARPRRHRRKWFVRMGAVIVEDQYLTVFDVAHILRTDDIERASLGREDR